ncbi:MAG TPA: 3-hydroxyacyl-CoA dehydrogenase NAD-binding domain-containing protein [Arenimonas sp.]|uniref:3-hydroxyacyl-CoA dehydrogenase NAD-binding domain-containing protein n=1 Tax=Arenimonas sp. TaxID=1872635 RepID=UPI002D7F6B38|nr:3-hydroxyacyl-CoA dehydrogenase NAD-binding domain-containing protein [Arenimonas sp.]HEU0152638.1 3-hydroxyacyl-CoA dehydrogenase NAD-binding domain-containing protein [Arenimonas sp.]
MFDGLRLAHWRADPRPDGILVLTLDRADQNVNALSRAVLDELESMVERIALELPKGVVIISGKAAGFIPGADIKSFGDIAAKGQTEDWIRHGQLVFQKLAELRCPTVAAIHGHCMGGGTEISLACRYRIASNDEKTRIGLPEVKLGIYPGWGGSVRAPRLLGAPAAMDLMLTGRALSASSARAIGLVDKVVAPAVLLDEAVKLAQRGTTRPLKQRLAAWATNTGLGRAILAPQIAKQVARKARKEHYPAPFALIETWRRSGGLPVHAALKAEAKSVVKLAASPTAHNLVRVFFLMDRLKSLGGKDHGIQKVHVIGAGVMGGDIAAWCALRGFEVTLQDRELKYIQPALDRAAKLFEKKVKDPARREATSARLKADVEGTGVAQADLVIEAIFENLEAKQALFAKVEETLKPGAILVSNTSSIPLTDLRAGRKDPARFAGLHYFNPVALMPLVEIVRHDGLDAETERRLAAFCKAIDKLPVPVAGTPGFLVNRILAPYMQEAIIAFSEGIPGPVIDKVALKFGMPMGPIELVDTVGLDVAASVGKIMADFHGLPLPDAFRVEDGKRGKKDGQGLYKWENGRAVKPVVPKDYQAPEDLEDRLLLPLLNEAVSCLHDGVVSDADLLDAGVIFGTGFAPFRGGPIQHIKAVGADKLKARLDTLHTRYGARFKPRAGWDAL